MAEPIDALVEAIPRVVETPATALDCGCGLGRHAAFLVDAGFTVDAFDANPKVIEVLSAFVARHAAPLRFFRADLADFVPQRTYDAIVAINVVHFLSPERGDQFLAHVRDATEPGGVAAIACLTGSPELAAAWPASSGWALYDVPALLARFPGWDVVEGGERELELEVRAPDGSVVRTRQAAVLVKKPR